MKVAILDARQGENRVAEKSYTVAYRNMSQLKDFFNADLFVNASDISQSSDYDAIICGFGSTSCEKEKSTDFLIRNKSAKIFWLVGEYEQSTFAPLFYSKREFEIIKNFEHPIKNKKATRQHFLNINTLLAKPSNQLSEKKYGSIYYGRWRPDRVDYFKKYLSSCVYLSTHSKNAKMFHHNGCSPNYIKPMTWRAGKESLNLFKTSLYIEDVFTHSNYNCLANRFYEALFCNTIPLFDVSCINTLESSNIFDYDWHVIDGAQDFLNKTKNIPASAKERIAKWNIIANNEKEETLANIKKIISGVVL